MSYRLPSMFTAERRWIVTCERCAWEDVTRDKPEAVAAARWHRDHDCEATR